MWSITPEDVDRAKEELKGRHAAIQARYEDEIQKLVASRSRVVLPVHRAAPSLGAPAVDPALGAPAPDPALLTLSGQPTRLSESLGDQAALLVFWRRWPSGIGRPCPTSARS